MGRRKTQVNGERKTQQQLSDEYRRRTYCNADLLSKIFAYIGMDSFPTTERPTNRNSPEFDEYNAHLDRIVVNLFDKYREQYMQQEQKGCAGQPTQPPVSVSPSIIPNLSQQKQQFNALASTNPGQVQRAPTPKLGQPNQCSSGHQNSCTPDCRYSFSPNPSCALTFGEPYNPNQVPQQISQIQSTDQSNPTNYQNSNRISAPIRQQNVYASNENIAYTSSSPSFAQSVNSPQFSFSQTSNSPQSNFTSSTTSSNFGRSITPTTFVHLNNSPLSNFVLPPANTIPTTQQCPQYVPQQLTSMPQPPTNTTPPKMDNYDRAFFNWLDEQIFESSNAAQYPPSQQTFIPQQQSIESQYQQSLNCSFDAESGIGSRQSTSSMPTNQHIFNFDQMNRAVGSNTMQRSGSETDSNYSDYSDDILAQNQPKINGQFVELQPPVTVPSQPLPSSSFGLSLRQQQIAFGPEILKQERPQKRNQPETIGRQMIDPQQPSSTAQPGQISLKKQKETQGVSQRRILTRGNTSSQRPKPSKKLFTEMTK